MMSENRVTGYCPVCCEHIRAAEKVCIVQPANGPPCLAHVTCYYRGITADEMGLYPTASEASNKLKADCFVWPTRAV
jgi:hypothetical protein